MNSSMFLWSRGTGWKKEAIFFLNSTTLYSLVSLPCVVWFTTVRVLGLAHRSKNNLELILFCFTQIAYFPFRQARVQQVRSAYLLQHRGQRHGDAALGAVRGAEPEPPVILLHGKTRAGVHTCNFSSSCCSSYKVFCFFLFLQNEPIDVGAAQVTSSVTRDCQKSHMPGGTGSWRHRAS